MHQDKQQNVINEINETFESIDQEIDNNSLNKLNYLDMVIKETMRLFPVLPIVARINSEEIQLGDYLIPAGTNILISTFKLQRNPKYWGNDADLFIPERFESERFKDVPQYAYIPFTAGHRICIGWKYGMLFMKTILVNVLRRYQVNSSLKYEDLEFEITLSMKIIQRYMISFQKRQR